MASSKDSVFDMIKLGLILVAYAVASCTVLAVVNNATSIKIRQNQIDKANSAMKAVLRMQMLLSLLRTFLPVQVRLLP